MYLNYFRLEKEPFHIATASDIFYMSTHHREALASMFYGVGKRLGFVALTGEVGTGKTSVLRAYLERIQGTDIRPILMFNPNLSFENFLFHILNGLGIDATDKSERWMLRALAHMLHTERKAGHVVVLIVDEAHNIPVDTLRQLHVISNMEAGSEKLLQVIFVGQPEFDDVLLDERLRQIRQRIAVRFSLKPLDYKESEAYMRYRIERAGGKPDALFPAPAMRAVIKAANGIPRMINVISDNALITAMGHNEKTVSPRIVREVVRDFSAPRRKRRWWKSVSAAAAATTLMVMALTIFGALSQPDCQMKNSGSTIAAPQSNLSGSTTLPGDVEKFI